MVVWLQCVRAMLCGVGVRWWCVIVVYMMMMMAVDVLCVCVCKVFIYTDVSDKK